MAEHFALLKMLRQPIILKDETPKRNTISINHTTDGFYMGFGPMSRNWLIFELKSMISGSLRGAKEKKTQTKSTTL